MARLLAPSDFGLFGIACLAINTLEAFTQTGFNAALVQKKEKIERYLDTVWTVSIIRKLILFLILFFSAPFAASFFDSPKAISIIRVIATTLLFSSVSNIGTIYFTKELDFRKQFVIRITKTIANIGIAIPLAFILRSTWALVWGMLAGSIVGCIMSYIIHPYRPRFHLEIAKAKELFTFGKWIFASIIIVFLLTQGDDILVGKLLGVTALGFYTMAYAISNLPATEITHAISEVTFPAYSKLQDNLPKLREAYLKILQLTAFISIPLAGGIFILASDFTKIFLGDKWMPIVPVIQVLVWCGVIRSLVGSMSPIFLSIGRPKIVTKLQAIQAVLLFILIYPLTVYGNILGVALAVLFSASAMFFIRNHILIKTIKCKIWEFYSPILLPLVFTMTAIFLIISLRLFVITPVNIYCFSLFVGIFILTFILLSHIAGKFLLNYRIRPLISKIFNSL